MIYAGLLGIHNDIQLTAEVIAKLSMLYHLENYLAL